MCCIVKCCNCHILLAVDMAGVACQGLVCMCVCVCATCKGTVVSFLPCSVAFWGFHPYNYVLSFFLAVGFWGEEKGMNGV